VIPSDVADKYREDLRAGFVARMSRTKNAEWRKFWHTEIMFLDNRTADAVSQLEALTGSEDHDVAVAALLSLGEWYEKSGSGDVAHGKYAEVVKRAPGAGSSARARTNRARLYNDAHEAALAANVLESVVVAIEDVPPDVVQFVVAEYCFALRNLGRVDEARTFIRRAVGIFPERIELPLLEERLLDAPVQPLA
jgi:tetratricopeptide (TPR) repeat protein